MTDILLVFEAFYRVDQARHMQKGGFGVGLVISKRIIDLHRGKISAENHPSSELCVTIELLLWADNKV